MSEFANQVMDLGNGKFEYVQDVWMREMLINAWQAITTTETWDFVRQDTDSFMFSSDTRVNIIGKKMEELGSNSLGSQDQGRSSIRKEYQRFYNFIKGGNDGLSSLRRETMFINILQGLHPLGFDRFHLCRRTCIHRNLRHLLHHCKYHHNPTVYLGMPLCT